MTSITMSKSPKHWVRETTPDARPSSSAMEVLRATAQRVHKQVLHLPDRPLAHAHEGIESLASDSEPHTG